MKELLTIAPPTPGFPPEVLDSAGGFVWWYADLVDAQQNGLVLIWSYGLPFLPGYTSAARDGTPEVPRERPSLNVAVYERGELACYLLQEFLPDAANWTGETWSFGGSRISSALDGGVRRLDVTLDCEMPGGDRLHGTLKLEGVARKGGDGDGYGGRHDWAPFTCCAEGRYELRAGSHGYSGNGSAYFDGNLGLGPLHDAGIHAWTWGRVPASGRDMVYYALWDRPGGTPHAVGLELRDDGDAVRFPVQVTDDRRARGRAGLEYPGSMTLSREGVPWVEVNTSSVIDDGPFYLRYFTEARCDELRSERLTGIGEFCRTDRIDLRRHRPLVRMRVHRLNRANSMWLPLFTGPREGRVARLLDQWGRR